MQAPSLEKKGKKRAVSLKQRKAERVLTLWQMLSNSEGTSGRSLHLCLKIGVYKTVHLPENEIKTGNKSIPEEFRRKRHALRIIIDLASAIDVWKSFDEEKKGLEVMKMTK